MNLQKLLLLPVFLLPFFSGCTTPNYATNLTHISGGNLKKVHWDELQGYHTDNLDEALRVFQKGCENTQKTLKNSCNLAKDANNSKSFFMTYFEPFKLYDKDGKDTGLITGYYEPLLYGSRTKSQKYQYPIYKKPNDLIVIDLKDFSENLPKMRLKGKIVKNKLLPYDTREMIEKRDDLEAICYVDDKVALFFLHIQGSGRVKLDTNETINIGYSEQNGRKYFAIGRKLVEDGELQKEEVSLQTIQKWLAKNPSKMDSVLHLNESYIFFNESNKSATGSLGIELVGGRNIAVDTSIIPLGYPVFLKTSNPLSKEKIDTLMIAADTGGAIKGEIRADFFFGYGEEAENLAGVMKEKGEMFLLVPKEHIVKENRDK